MHGTDSAVGANSMLSSVSAAFEAKDGHRATITQSGAMSPGAMRMAVDAAASRIVSTNDCRTQEALSSRAGNVPLAPPPCRGIPQ
jgi:hypothetical protein